jgi:hypothetical protein
MVSNPARIFRWAPLVALLLFAPAAGAAPRRGAFPPGLGAFAQEATLQGTVSGQPFTWKGVITYTPGPGTTRTVSGSGTFTLGGPPDPVALAWLAMAPTSVLGGAGATCNVVLSRPPAVPIQVALKSSNPSVLTVPPTVSFNVGQTAAPVAVTTTSVTAIILASVTATYNGQSRGANLQINPLPLPPAPPVITAVTDVSGAAIPAAGLVVGSIIVINGSHFGPPGKVFWGMFEIIVQSWTDTKVVAALSLPANSVWSGSQLVVLQTAAGLKASSPSPLTVIPLPPELPRLAVSDNPVLFGDVPLASSSGGVTKSITITNSGHGMLVGKVGPLTGGSAFAITQGAGVSFSLAAGQVLPVSVNFKPLTTGAQQTVLSLTSNDPAGVQGVTFKGNGVSPPPPGNPLIEKIRATDDGPLIWPLKVGQKAKVIGQGFGSAGARLWVNGFPTPFDTWTDTAIIFTLNEDSTRIYPGWVTVENANGNLYSGNFNKDGSGPVPEPPLFTGFFDLNGNPVTEAVEGTVLVLKGSHFGERGMVIYSNWAVCEVLSWTDTEIRFKAPFTWWDKRVSSIEVYAGRGPGLLNGRKGFWPRFTVTPAPNNAGPPDYHVPGPGERNGLQPGARSGVPVLDNVDQVYSRPNVRRR